MSRRRRDPIARTRSILYTTAKLLGDVQAGRRAVRQRSLLPIVERIARREVGSQIAQLQSRLFRHFPKG